MPGSVQRQRSERAVTTIELVVVLLIVMILAGMVVPAVASGVRASKLRDAATRTATAFRRARSMAILASEMYCAQAVPVVAGSGTYQVTIFKALDTGAKDPAFPAGGVLLPRGVKFTEAAPASPENIVFLPDGSIAGDMFGRLEDVWIVAEDAAPPYSDDRRYVVSFSALTGRIAVRFGD